MNFRSPDRYCRQRERRPGPKLRHCTRVGFGLWLRSAAMAEW